MSGMPNGSTSTRATSRRMNFQTTIPPSFTVFDVKSHSSPRSVRARSIFVRASFGSTVISLVWIGEAVSGFVGGAVVLELSNTGPWVSGSMPDPVLATGALKIASALAGPDGLGATPPDSATQIAARPRAVLMTRRILSMRTLGTTETLHVPDVLCGGLPPSYNSRPTVNPCPAVIYLAIIVTPQVAQAQDEIQRARQLIDERKAAEA